MGITTGLLFIQIGVSHLKIKCGRFIILSYRCPVFWGNSCGAKYFDKTLKNPNLLIKIPKADDILFNYAAHECAKYLPNHKIEKYSQALELALTRVIELKSKEYRLLYVSSNNIPLGKNQWRNRFWSDKYVFGTQRKRQKTVHRFDVDAQYYTFNHRNTRTRIT